jgi:hypothetical protein
VSASDAFRDRQFPRSQNRLAQHALMIITIPLPQADQKMYDAYKKAQSAQDYENKWMYFGGADGAYSIFPGVC